MSGHVAGSPVRGRPTRRRCRSRRLWLLNPMWHGLAASGRVRHRLTASANAGNCWQHWKLLATLEIAGNAGKKSGDPFPAFPAIPAPPAKQRFLAPARPTGTWPPHRAAPALAGNDSARNDARTGRSAAAAGRKAVQQAGKSVAHTFDGTPLFSSTHHISG